MAVPNGGNLTVLGSNVRSLQFTRKIERRDNGSTIGASQGEDVERRSGIWIDSSLTIGIVGALRRLHGARPGLNSA
jgi:hypothetical protein